MNRLSLLILLFCVACSSLQSEPTAITCNGYALTAQALPFCEVIPAGTLIQAPLNQQVQITLPAGQFTMSGTALIFVDGSLMQISILEGSGILALSGQYKNLSAGEALSITQHENTLIIGEASPYDLNHLSSLPLDRLPRQIKLIIPTATPQAPPNLIEGCQAPADWTDRYSIQRGNTLTSLAEAFNLTLAELQEGNCINNANQIQVGDVIYAPFGSVKPTQPAVTYTPSAVDFRVDRVNINDGECTIIRWDVRNVSAIFLDNQAVGEQGSQEVCPVETSIYQLKVIYFDATETQHQVSVTVTKS